MFEDKKNYYDVLEIEPSASMQEIHDAYNKARNAYAGDSAALYSLMSADDCARILDQIEEAYSILGVMEKRSQYDKARGFNQEEYNLEKDYSDSKTQKRDLEKLVKESSDKLAQDKYTDVEREKHFKYKEVKDSKDEISVSRVQAIKRFSIEYEPNPEMELKIENAVEFTGPFLKEIREYKNVSVERLADMTRISKTYIRNIEDDEFEKLPAAAYTRGFVFQYAKCLKLNPDHVANAYIKYFKENKNKTHA
jgi:curved DNA-binding protein CbpA